MTVTDGKTALWVPPEIPSKWDIIPIHNSDRAAFKRCRRYWHWSSPAHHNLTLRADVYGVNPNFFFGNGIHYALENYYQPGIRRDPIESFCEWFDIQWRGGEVTGDWLPRVYDLKPRMVRHDKYLRTDKLAQHIYQVRGLEDILPDPDHDEWLEYRVLGINMLENYKRYAAIYDDFEVLIAEHDFSVPIWDYENDCILKMVDTREDSPNYGKKIEVHSRGRTDAITVKPNGKFGIVDHKTAEKVGEDEFEKLETDEQCTSYLHAIEVEAQYYNLPHKGEVIEEVLYNVLRKAYPKPPTELKNGMFSVDRQNESTTYEMLQNWLATHMPGIPLNEKQKGYVEWLRDVGEEQFIIRKHVRRNRHQLKNAGYRLYLEAMDMLDPDIRIYPNLKNDWSCLRCVFRAPCLATEDGSDAQQLLDSNYTSNKDR
jgi:hypothetical protein